MALNRNSPPLLKVPDEIIFKGANKFISSNNIEVLTIHAGDQEILQVECCFKAGKFAQKRPLSAGITNKLLTSGTVSWSEFELMEQIDNTGAIIQTEMGYDLASVSLLTLTSKYKYALPFMFDVIGNANFPKVRFDQKIQEGKEQFKLNCEKVSFLSSIEFMSTLFGAKHPYGMSHKMEDFDRIDLTDIIDFRNTNYLNDEMFIVASGKIPEDFEHTIGSLIDQLNLKNKKGVGLLKPNKIVGQREMFKFIEKQDAVQNAIKIGGLIMPVTHPDYIPFLVLNTVLGGYFGSRLMSNIREDKGYTYGIGSGLVHMMHSNFFCISTEVGADFTHQTIDEINKEINRLREEPIPQNELELVKNYLSGEFLQAVDGPFARIEVVKNFHLNSENEEAFNRRFQEVKSVQPEKLLEMANKYLNASNMVTIVAGRKYDKS